ncbi:ABC transporter substrate-binding protein [Marmoricola sp. RAF53]|uniref:ABC transporter substrate-binding protein n=1 Tax=Marmoricola sp. RAF53 TaxID=3233059 RepID=UPI003F983AB9
MAAIAFALFASGCSSSDASGDSASRSGGSADDSGTPATGKPIRIGYSNTEGKGANSFPSYTLGAELAVKWVNSHGGVNGRPLELDKCLTDGSTASSLSCANRFADAKDSVVLSGYDLGADAMVPVLDGAKIPAFGIIFQGTKAQADPNFYQVAAPLATAFTLPFGTFADADKKNVAFVNVDVPIVQEVFNSMLKPMAAQLGLSISLVTYDPASLDFSSVAATLVANGYDAVLFAGSDEQCNAFAGAASTMSYQGLMNMGTCSQFAAKHGSKVAGYQSLGFVYPPEARDSTPSAEQADIDQYVNDVEQAGKQDEADKFSVDGYAAVMDLANVLKTVKGPVDAASVTSAFNSLAAFDGFAGNTLDCAHRSAAQGAACDTEMLLMEVSSDGTSLDVVGGGFTSPPTS